MICYTILYYYITLYYSLYDSIYNILPRPRSNMIGAVARVRAALAQATHEFFRSRGFLYARALAINDDNTTSDDSIHVISHDDATTNDVIAIIVIIIVILIIIIILILIVTYIRGFLYARAPGEPGRE